MHLLPGTAQEVPSIRLTAKACSSQATRKRISRLGEDAHNMIVRSAIEGAAISCVAIIFSALLLSGCASFSARDPCGDECGSKAECLGQCRDSVECRSDCPADDKDCVAKCQDRLSCIAGFYLPYAILAADVYSTRGSAIERFQLIADEQTLRNIAGGANFTIDTVHKLYENARSAYRSGSCLSPENLRDIFNSGDEQLQDAIPSKPEDCMESRKNGGTPKRVRVPVSAGTAHFGWERVKEMEKYSTTRSWFIFVPELAIEVWRRYPEDKHPDDKTISPYEYAIVFRGTTGLGGWLSNFRAITALLPIFWDQYQQAETSARRIVEQIFMVEFLRAYRKNTDDPLKELRLPLITLVGHSLGGGLAKYVYFKLPETSRVIAFNPSPIDGSRTLVSLDERGRMMIEKTEVNSRSQKATGSPRAYGDPPDCVANPRRFAGGEPPTMFMLYERGEILSSISHCVSGKEWGDDGGPVSECHDVDLNRGDPVYQHKMNILACKMALKYLQKQMVFPEPAEPESNDTETENDATLCPPAPSHTDYPVDQLDRDRSHTTDSLTGG